MKKTILLLSMLAVTLQGFAQKAEAEELEKKLKQDNTALPNGWSKGGSVNLAMNQVQTSNWVGASEKYQLGLAGLATAFGNRKKGTTLWLNSGMLQMGVQRTPSTFDQFRKNSDQLTLSTMYAPQIKPKWYYAGSIDLRTQVGNTLDYKNVLTTKVKDGVTIPATWGRTGGFMAPGYIRAGVGILYTPSKNLRVYFSPLTANITTKLGAAFKPLNLYGVAPGKSVDFGLGALLRADYQNKFKNGMTYTSRLDLFTNYLDNPFTHTDVDWVNGLGFTIGKNITAAVNLNFRYYHNQITELQWMEMLGLGFNYKL
jgi:hypothetical protein